MTVEVIAHRGMGSEFVEPDQPPENTLPSFEAAWKAGADACEVDVHLTADHQVVAIHDSTTGRTANADLVVANSTLAELQKLDAGSWKGASWAGVRFATLSEVLAIVPAGKRLFVEIKTGPSTVPHVAEAIRESTRTSAEVVIISFNCESLAASKAAMPDVRHYLLVKFEQDPKTGEWTMGIAQTKSGTQESELILDQPADIIHLIELVRLHGFDGLDVSETQPDNFADQMREAQIEWKVWTVDCPGAAATMARRGATSITTNRLRVITDALCSRGL